MRSALWSTIALVQGQGYDGTEGPEFYWRYPRQDLQGRLLQSQGLLSLLSLNPSLNPPAIGLTQPAGPLSPGSSPLSPLSPSPPQFGEGQASNGASIPGLANSIPGLPGEGGLPQISLPPSQSVASVWNNLTQQVADDAKALSLPSIDYNFSLPEVNQIGNLGSLPVISQGIGSNLGNTIGKTTGNLLTSTANLWGNTLGGAAENFLSVFSPTLQELASIFKEPPRSRILLQEPVGHAAGNGVATSPMVATVSPSPMAGSPIGRSPHPGGLVGMANPLTQALSSSLGNMVGSSTGNLVGGTAQLLSSTGQSFLSSFMKRRLAELEAEQQYLRALEKGHQRRLQELESRINQLERPRRRLQALDTSTLAADPQPVSTAANPGFSTEPAEPAGASTELECQVSNTQYLSVDGATYSNVASIVECQKICQLHSSPPIPQSCLLKELPKTESCVGVSFSRLNGDCTIYNSVHGLVRGVSGVDSAPNACSNATYYQTLTQAQGLAGFVDPACQAYDLNSIILVDSNALPTPSHTPASSTVSKMNLFPIFFDANESTEFYKVNPPWPPAQAADFKVQYLVQPFMLDQSAKSIAADWRLCAYLCHLHGSKLCGSWSYLYPTGDCVLAPPSAQLVKLPDNVPENLQTVTGPYLPDPLPEDLFALPQTPAARRLSAVPSEGSWKPMLMADQMQPSGDNDFFLPELLGGGRRLETSPPLCEFEVGVMYYSPHAKEANGVPQAIPVLTADAESCRRVCDSTSGCVGFQYVSVEEISSSRRLYETQNLPCLLLSQMPSSKVSAGTVNIVSGGRTGTSNEDCPAYARGLEYTSPATLQSVGDGETADCKDEKGNGYSYAHGASLRGELLSGASNVLVGVSKASDCHNECKETAGCSGWTWGKWGGCYLMSSVEAWISDDADFVVSGLSQCQKLPPHKSSKRQLSDCSRVYRGQVFATESMFKNETASSADECWKLCRSEFGCHFMTFVDHECQLMSAQEGAKPSSVGSQEPSTTSVGSQEPPISAEPNCDVIGDLSFSDTSFWQGSSKTAAIVTGAAVGLAGVILTGALIRKQPRTVSVEVKDTISPHKTPAVVRLDETDLDDGMNDTRQKRRWNVFGMGSPDPASPGALERGSPKLIKVDDFQTIEKNVNKSTGKRYFGSDTL